MNLGHQQGVTGQFDVPSWASKPPPGHHLDVLKGDKMVQKLMIDEKKYYLFGRNPQLNDFQIDHQSCSRVHAALVYHSALDKCFLYDLGSTHGTFIGTVKLEPYKAVQLHLDTKFHFGMSTREYVLRSRPTTSNRPIMEELERGTSENDGGLLGLPETDTELDNLTEFNTAHNKRLQMLGIPETDGVKKASKRKRSSVTFNEEDEIINPEDVDPNVGRFRNLVQTTTIPIAKKSRNSSGLVPVSTTQSPKPQQFVTKSVSLYDDLMPDENQHAAIPSPYFTSFMSSKLGLPLPNPAPEIESAMDSPEPPKSLTSEITIQQIAVKHPASFQESSDEPKKKRYAKEAWPGKKPGSTNLLV